MRTQQSVRGVLKGMGGISMVCTFPEARMKGYVRSIMQSAFLEMKETGLSVSMLEPFRETFYVRLGYVPAYEKFRLKAPLDGLHLVHLEREPSLVDHALQAVRLAPATGPADRRAPR